MKEGEGNKYSFTAVCIKLLKCHLTGDVCNNLSSERAHRAATNPASISDLNTKLVCVFTQSPKDRAENESPNSADTETIKKQINHTDEGLHAHDLGRDGKGKMPLITVDNSKYTFNLDNFRIDMTLR